VAGPHLDSPGARQKIVERLCGDFVLGERTMLPVEVKWAGNLFNFK
jgi:hypothetical protein